MFIKIYKTCDFSIINFHLVINFKITDEEIKKIDTLANYTS